MERGGERESEISSNCYNLGFYSLDHSMVISQMEVSRPNLLQSLCLVGSTLTAPQG